MKRIAKAALRTLGLEINRLAPEAPNLEAMYLEHGRIPWSPGYSEAKERFIREAIANHLEPFRHGGRLPTQWGVGLDERCVEYPWLLSKLKDGPEHLLDAGSILNQQFILDHAIFREKKLHILTLAPEDSCFWHKGVSYFYDDLRDLPIRNEYYDTIVCLSTLEHVGCDNARYSQAETHRQERLDDFLLVMRELRRVLRPGGTLFLTVPFGVYTYLGAFQQFDRQMLGRAVEAFGNTAERVATFYRYSADGWQIADVASCANCEFGAYGELIKRPPGKGEHAGLVRPDLPAAAGAVACLHLTKE